MDDTFMALADERSDLLQVLWQLLDDMGPDGLGVCQATKDEAMRVYRQCLPAEPRDDWPGCFLDDTKEQSNG